MALQDSFILTLFLYACVYAVVECNTTYRNMLECTRYNIQQVGSKVDNMQSNMAAIVNRLSQMQVQIATNKEKMQPKMATEIQQIQQQMATEREEMQQEIKNLTLKLESHLSEEKCKPEKEELSGYVSFTAYATEIRDYNLNDHVMFDATLRNYGSAYFVNVSEFICPVNAYYLVSVSLLADKGKWMYGTIMLDDEELVITCAMADREYPSSSQTMVTYCEARQRIWVKCSRNDNRMHSYLNRPFSTFGVTLLRVD